MYRKRLKGIILSTFLLSLATLALGQGYWQQHVDYKMDIDFDVTTHRFTGSQSLTYTNNSPDTLVKAYYHLYFNAFQPNSMMDVRSRTIDDPDGRVRDRIYHLKENEIGYHNINSLTQDGVTPDYHVEGTVLEITLAQPILPGASTQFEMTFDSQVPLQIRRSGRDNREGISYSMAQWFPKLAEYDKKGWHAHPYVGREFHAPWGNYEVNLTIDSEYVVAATGILQNRNAIGHGYEEKGVKIRRPDKEQLTWQFKAENVHDFVWAADPDYEHTIVQVPDGPEVHFFYQTDTLKKNWEKLPDFTVKAFQYINENFGKYPFPKYSVIQGGDGGMEYPMATLITGHRSMGSLVGVTVHEALHSWYQGVLATNESYYAWMDEGFTSYASSLTMNHLFGGDPETALAGNYGGYFSLAYSGAEEPLSTHADHFTTNYAYGSGSYSKGAVSIAQLGYIIGEENRNKGLKRYFEEWGFKHPDLNDFIRVMEKTSGLELDWYYEYWINTTHQIDYGITEVQENDGTATVTLERIGTMPMPMDIVVTYSNGETSTHYIPLGLMRGEKPATGPRTVEEDWPWTHPQYTLEVDTQGRSIRSITIDPSGLMADVNQDNNRWPITND